MSLVYTLGNYRVFQNKVSTLKSPAKIRDLMYQVGTYLEYVLYWSNLRIKTIGLNKFQLQKKENENGSNRSVFLFCTCFVLEVESWIFN